MEERSTCGILQKASPQLGCEVHALISVDPTMEELAVNLAKVATVHRLKLTNTYRRPMRAVGAVADANQKKRVRHFIDSLSPDVVHINQQVAEDGLDLLLAARDCHRPFVSTIHITRPAAALGAKIGILRDYVAERVLSRTAAPYIVVSAAAQVGLHARRRLVTADVCVVYPGVRQIDPPTCIEARRCARCDWGVVDESELVIGSVGRIEDQKNPLFLIELLAELVNSGRNARLVWIGDGDLRPRFEAQAIKRAVAERLIIDGWRSDAQLRMSGFDIFVLPSRYEGLPLALLEAMHAGLAVCVSDADGMPEAISDGQNGYIRSLSATDDWRDAVHSLAFDAEKRARFGAAARETARSRFSIEAMTGATYAVYEQAIANKAHV